LKKEFYLEKSLGDSKKKRGTGYRLDEDVKEGDACYPRGKKGPLFLGEAEGGKKRKGSLPIAE